jgi:hypothetical protein
MSARRDYYLEIVADLHARLDVAVAAGDLEPPEDDLAFALELQRRIHWLDFVAEHAAGFEESTATNEAGG